MARASLLIAALTLTAGGICNVGAEAPTLAGKTVTMIIAAGAGDGGLNVWGRIVARHIGRNLPGNPTVVAQNMPGAGGFVAANHIYNVAAKDGTAMAITVSPTPLGPIMGAPGARFDATRMTYVGTPSMETPACIAFNRPQVRVRTARDLYEHELIVGATGPGAGTYVLPKALSALLGMKFKVVAGFQSSSAVFLAIERGEIDGMCAILDTITGQRPDWIATRQVALLFHGASTPSPALDGVPFLGDLAGNRDDRAVVDFLLAGIGVARPILAPPDMAPGRAAMLQSAFMATMKDPDFLADAKRQKLAVDPRDGAYLAALITRIYATPRAIVDRVVNAIK